MTGSPLLREVTDAYRDQTPIARSDFRYALGFLRRAPRLASLFGVVFVVGGALSALGYLRADTLVFRLAGAGLFFACAGIAFVSAAQGLSIERGEHPRELESKWRTPVLESREPKTSKTGRDRQ